MKPWFTGLSLVWKAALALGLVVVLFLTYNFVDDLFSKKDEVRAELSQNQTDTAIKSGKDTVTTINNQHTKEIQRTETVRIIQGQVNEAPDVHSAHTAGADGLCHDYNICAKD